MAAKKYLPTLDEWLLTARWEVSKQDYRNYSTWRVVSRRSAFSEVRAHGKVEKIIRAHSKQGLTRSSLVLGLRRRQGD